MLEQRIQQHFFDIADLQYQSAESLSRPIADAAQTLVDCITAGGKLLVVGAGPAAALSLHFCAAFVHRFERERPGLAALSLCADGVVLSALDGGAAFVKQLQALGQPGDVLLALHAGDPGQGMAALIDAAHAKDMSVVLLCGRAPAPALDMLGETDVRVSIPHERAARVLEMQLVVLHCLCDAVDLQLMGEQEPL
jgi:D-sedoheptulose 7-phosphate isomerase